MICCAYGAQHSHSYKEAYKPHKRPTKLLMRSVDSIEKNWFYASQIAGGVDQNIATVYLG